MRNIFTKILSLSSQANAQLFRGKIEYCSSVFPSEDGKIKSIGNIKFEYNNSGAQKNVGKVKSITNENDDSEAEDALDTYYFIERLNCQ
ncbi:hypothetical protein QFZ20_000428 [Flavobacterium sp. W4I14]|nr:hypothetical protein [Flavobacterium sp. W4I14]